MSNLENEVNQSVDIITYTMNHITELTMIDQLNVIQEHFKFSKALLPYYMKLKNEKKSESYIIKL